MSQQNIFPSRSFLQQPATYWIEKNDENSYQLNAEDSKIRMDLRNNETVENFNKTKCQEESLFNKFQNEEDEFDYDPSEASDQVNFYVCPYCGPRQTFLYESAYQEHMRVSVCSNY